MEGREGKALVERVESLEAELEEQRRELRYEVRRLDRLLAGRAMEADLRGMPDVASAGSASEASAVGDATASAGGLLRRWFSVGGAYEDRQERRGFRFPAFPGNLVGGEWWLNKIGIGLLLFGAAFLFKFSVDQNWITPSVRVGIGLLIGATLIALGMRVYAERPAFGQVLLGGGVGVFYISGFAAFELYALVPYTAAFGFMIAVTILATFLALRQNEPVLALIGALGAFGTPFLLYDESARISGLVLYTCLVLAGICAMYLYRGWRSLLLTSFAGVWTVFLIGYTNLSHTPEPAFDEQLALQLGVVFAWISLWITPAVREVLRSRGAGRWPLPEPGRVLRMVFPDQRILGSNAPAHMLSVATPLVALVFTQRIWDLEKAPAGWISLGGAVIYALAWSICSRFERGGNISYTQALTALLLGTLALALLLEADALLVTLAVEATVLHLISRRLSDKVLSREAHSLFVVVIFWLGGRLLQSIVDITFGTAYERPPFLTLPALVDLLVIAALFGASSILAHPISVRAYRTIGHLGALALILTEFVSLPHGGTLALVAWGIYGLGLILLSRYLREWGTATEAHLLWAVVGLWLAVRLLAGTVGLDASTTAVLNTRGLGDVAVISLALGASFLLQSRQTTLVYRLAAHAAILVWLWRELSLLPNGNAYVSIAWGAYAAALLIFGLRRDNDQCARAGMATLFLVVAKLFLVDLVGVDAIWRILLFLGFGGLFLALSYYLQALWRPDGRTVDAGRPGTTQGRS